MSHFLTSVEFRQSVLSARHPHVSHLVGALTVEVDSSSFGFSTGGEHRLHSLSCRRGVNGQQCSGVVVAGDVVSAHRLCSHEGESSRNGQGATDDDTVGQEHQADQQGDDAFILHHGSGL